MFTRKSGLLALGAALAASFLAAVALGQEVIPIRIVDTVKVIPDKAGTPRHPQGIGIDIGGTIDTLGGRAPLMPRSVEVWLPKGWLYNGADHPACPQATLAHNGPTACPPRSIMGRGVLGPPDLGDATTPPRVTIFNGGRTKMYFWVVVINPARTQTLVTGTITKLGSPHWSYRLHANIPRSLHVVSGIPVVLKSFHARVGRDDWIATTRCPHDHRWRYHLKMTYTSGQVVDTGGTVPCRS